MPFFNTLLGHFQGVGDLRGKNELDKSKVKSLYLDGFSANEIAIRMDSNREAEKKCI